MGGISVNEPQLPAQAISTPSSPAPRTEASAQQGPAQLGFSRSDAFESGGGTQDPLAAATGQLNSQSAGRAGLVQGQLQFMDGLMATNNRAYGWHKLMMELLSLIRPS